MSKPMLALISQCEYYDDYQILGIVTVPSGRNLTEDVEAYRAMIQELVNAKVALQLKQDQEALSTADITITENQLHEKDRLRARLPKDSPERHALWHETRPLAKKLKQHKDKYQRLTQEAEDSVVIALCNNYGVTATTIDELRMSTYRLKGLLLIAYLVRLGYVAAEYDEVSP